MSPLLEAIGCRLSVVVLALPVGQLFIQDALLVARLAIDYVAKTRRLLPGESVTDR